MLQAPEENLRASVGPTECIYEANEKKKKARKGIGRRVSTGTGRGHGTRIRRRYTKRDSDAIDRDGKYPVPPNGTNPVCSAGAAAVVALLVPEARVEAVGGAVAIGVGLGSGYPR